MLLVLAQGFDSLLDGALDGLLVALGDQGVGFASFLPLNWAAGGDSRGDDSFVIEVVERHALGDGPENDWKNRRGVGVPMGV